ncbi:MAG: lipid A-modifier LpxR family protein [Granulosicoccus sp.]
MKKTRYTESQIHAEISTYSSRPYASLFFLNSTEQVILPAKKMSVKSSFTVGLLGLDLAETLQRSFHGAIGSEKPEGWEHQISSGGELTAKYGLSMQRALYQQAYASGLAQELNWTAKGDLGFTTDVSENIRIDVFVRARTKDVDLEESRELAWGGLTISRRL